MTIRSTFMRYCSDFLLDDTDYRGILRAADENGVRYDLSEVREMWSTKAKADWFADLAEEVRQEAANNVLSIDTEIVIDVLLGCGGPTTYLRFFAERDKNGYYESIRNAEFRTTDTPDGKLDVCYLSGSETDELWNRFGLDCYQG